MSCSESAFCLNFTSALTLDIVHPDFLVNSSRFLLKTQMPLLRHIQDRFDRIRESYRRWVEARQDRRERQDKDAKQRREWEKNAHFCEELGIEYTPKGYISLPG